ncbi:GNAT family N-acetyltransferase [Streptococcus loxodontisalivarius]|uniref:GNAT superfamily N-acetyltransferase n=1 Tax=Streptococcus loxodontisalivarius TaxID=1349415 RepID=A0ABS2PV83_9STRE|nr:GNAT family N-acetyltransferase [Streptococcus loxodontisalivarius]MBM7643791.1 GNAT superfamily N-acetyltransferase [Streptococcus loxodontisalivarius]
MDIRIVTEDFQDMELLDALNREAFPEEERVETRDLIAYSLAAGREFLAFYDGETFIGFAVIMLSDQMIYMSFFAVEQRLRSQGYGSRILTAISQRYPKRSFCLEVERLDEPSENMAERRARRAFYAKNGFEETDYRLEYGDLSFDILSKGTFVKEAYDALLSSIASFEFSIKSIRK